MTELPRINRRDVLVGIAAVNSLGIAGCTGGDSPSNTRDEDDTAQTDASAASTKACTEADFEVTRVVPVDATTVDLVIQNRSGEQIKPDEVIVVRDDGEQFSVEMPTGAYVERRDNFSVEVEINSGPDSIAQVELRYYDSQGNNPTTSNVCVGSSDGSGSEEGESSSAELDLEWDMSSAGCNQSEGGFEVSGALISNMDQSVSIEVIWILTLPEDDFGRGINVRLPPQGGENLNLLIPFSEMTSSEQEMACNPDKMTFEIFARREGESISEAIKILEI